MVQNIRQIGEARVCTSIIVAAELCYGATKKGSTRLTTQVEAVLGALDVLPFEAPSDIVREIYFTAPIDLPARWRYPWGVWTFMGIPLGSIFHKLPSPACGCRT